MIYSPCAIYRKIYKNLISYKPFLIKERGIVLIKEHCPPITTVLCFKILFSLKINNFALFTN